MTVSDIMAAYIKQKISFQDIMLFRVLRPSLFCLCVSRDGVAGGPGPAVPIRDGRL